MKKSQVKLGFRNLGVPEKIQRAKSIYGAMLAHKELFPSPFPKFETMHGAFDQLEKAYQEAQNGGPLQRKAMKERAAELTSLIRDLAAYVQNISQGNAEIILASGFEVKAPATPIGVLQRPLRLRAATSELTGDLDLDWKKVAGAGTYNIEHSPNGTDGWNLIGQSTKAQFTAKALPNATYQWFRVAGVGAAGQGPWSDAAKGLVA